MKTTLRAVATLLFVAAGLFAQTSRGTVTGLVTDASASAIAGAKVELTNVTTGVLRPTTTNDAGIYRFDAVDPGSYELSISKTGFRTTKSNAFDVSGAQ